MSGQSNFTLWIGAGLFASVCLLILGLLARVTLSRRSPGGAAGKTPAPQSPRDMMWTVAPMLVFALVVIPVSQRLYFRHATPSADMTITVTGHMWYWTFRYPDGGNFTFNAPMVSNPAGEKIPDPAPSSMGDHIIVPVDRTIRIVAVATNVIYSWTIPSLGASFEAVPGWSNETSFRAAKEGLYIGRCSELCGLPHKFKPIEIEVVSQARFDKWIAEAKARPHPVVTSADAEGSRE